MIYRPEVAVGDVRQRAALAIYSTLLGGSMGSRLFDEIREKRGLCYSVYAISHAFADVPILQLGSGLDSTKTIEAYTRMREIVVELRDDGPDRGGGRAGARLRRRAPRAGVRELERRRAPRRQPVDRLRRVDRPRRGDRRARRRHLRRGPRDRRRDRGPPRRRASSGRTRRRSSRTRPGRLRGRPAARVAEARPASCDARAVSASFVDPRVVADQLADPAGRLRDIE